MSDAPRPYSLPSRCVGVKGSLLHWSSGPVGTTSVWPAKARVLAPARLDVRGVSLTIALTRLASESGVSVGFSPTKLRSDSRTVACRCADLTIAEALNRLLIGLPVRYEERENQIVVVPGAGTPLMPEVAALNVTEAAALPIITTNQRIAADSIVSGRVRTGVV